MLRGRTAPDGYPTGLAEVYLAQSRIELGDYAGAERLVRGNAARDTHPVAAMRGRIMLAPALAGQGRIAEARAIMDELGWDGVDQADPTQGRFPFLIHAEALIARAEGNHDRALELMKRRGDTVVANLQRTNADDMTALLANLENTRERQIERANALKREAALKAVQLEQAQTLNRMLLALLAALGLGIVALIVFLRYRERVNAEVQDLQEQALSAERMKTEFLGLINHELRTPLNAVIGISDAMIHHSPDAAIRGQAQAIQDSGEQLFDLLESLIDMSTIEAGKMQIVPDETDLSQVILTEAARWDRHADAKSLAFTRYVGPELSLAVEADAARLRQCLKILLSNAVRFTHSGRVHLHATAERRDGGLDLTLVVADTGQGISEAVQARLFQPFVQADATMTRKYGGAGLSLSIARKLARMMGGDVVVSSAVDRGTEFTLTARLPLVERVAADPEREQTPEPEPAEPAFAEPAFHDTMIDAPQFAPAPSAPELAPAALRDPDNLRGRAVLVVEDLPSNQDVIGLLLEPFGVECIAALSAEAALRILQTRRVDGVIMDIRMPGLDGLEATRRIRTGGGPNADVPVVVLSADAAAETAALARDAGADAFLAKPVLRRDLRDALLRALDRRAPTALSA